MYHLMFGIGSDIQAKYNNLKNYFSNQTNRWKTATYSILSLAAVGAVVGYLEINQLRQINKLQYEHIWLLNKSIEQDKIIDSLNNKAKGLEHYADSLYNSLPDNSKKGIKQPKQKVKPKKRKNEIELPELEDLFKQQPKRVEVDYKNV